MKVWFWHFLTFIKFVDEAKVKEEIKDNSDNENETIDQLEIPVNNEIKDDMEQGNLFRDIGNFSGAWYELSFGTVS